MFTSAYMLYVGWSAFDGPDCICSVDVEVPD